MSAITASERMSLNGSANGETNGFHYNGDGHGGGDIVTRDHTLIRQDGFFSSVSNAADGKHFRLEPEFIGKYLWRRPNFGYGALGELVFYRTYSRLKPNGKKETFLDVLTRVVEGCYEIQRRHCRSIHVPWDYDKAQVSAQEMFTRMWDFKFLPPGRGLWCMGTPFMWERGSAALNNCGFCSTEDISVDPAEPFCFMMDMSMLGVGVGFDTRGAGTVPVVQPHQRIRTRYIIDDSREGWVDSVRVLIKSFTSNPEFGNVVFDYRGIRPAGEPIKGFGGFASGPGILQELHDLIRALLTSRIGRLLSSVDIVDLMNLIGKCVVAGNVRRTAEIAFGDADDPDYTTMKDPTRWLRPEELPVWFAVTGYLYDIRKDAPQTSVAEFLTLQADIAGLTRRQAAATGKGGEYDARYNTLCALQDVAIDRDRLALAVETHNYLNQHRWASNNSVYAKVGMDYSRLARQSAINGEPGYIWLDNLRNYGRMKDGYRPGIDGRVMGTNPCLAGGMRLLTATGYRTVAELWAEGGHQEYDGSPSIRKHGELRIVNHRGIVPATNVYRTAEAARVYRVEFSNGQHIDATENHRFVVLDGDRETVVQTKDLVPGSRVPLGLTQVFGGHDDLSYALLAGWVIGDGSLSPQKDGQVTAVVSCYEADAEVAMPLLRNAMLATYERHRLSSDQRPTFEPWERKQEHFRHRQTNIRSSVLGRLLAEDGVVPGDKHRVPASVWRGNRKTVASFLCGFFSADGSVQANETKKSISIRVCQVHRRILDECQLLLAQFGIASTVLLRRQPSQKLMNDGKGGRKLYNKRAEYELIISGRANVQIYMDEIGFLQPKKTLVAADWLHQHPGSNNSALRTWREVVTVTYLGEEPTYCLTEPETNRVIVNGILISQCGEQSLESYELCNLVETFPDSHDDVTDYMRTLKFAYLYAKTVTLLSTHNARTNSVMLRNRRIGVSQSGIQQAFIKFGRRRMLREFCDRGYDVICEWDRIYSRWLCVPESIKKTDVKPSGTVSLVAGKTPGIHHPEDLHYWRRVRIAKDSVLVTLLAEAGYHIEPAISDPDRTVVVRFGVNEDQRLRSVKEVSIWEQVADVIDYQHYWTDNQPSCTVKFMPHEAAQLPRVLEAAEDKLKALSVMPIVNHNFPQLPYEPTSKAEVDAYNATLKPIDFSRWIGEDAVGAKFCDGDTCSLM